MALSIKKTYFFILSFFPPIQHERALQGSDDVDLFFHVGEDEVDGGGKV